MELEDTENCRCISIDVKDAQLFRGGEEPISSTPLVSVRFFNDDIEDLKDTESQENVTEDIFNIKDKVIDWSARAAGGLDESEFYCLGIDIEVNKKGEMVKGETLFKRRYVL